MYMYIMMEFSDKNSFKVLGSPLKSIENEYFIQTFELLRMPENWLNVVEVEIIIIQTFKTCICCIKLTLLSNTNLYNGFLSCCQKT